LLVRTLSLERIDFATEGTGHRFLLQGVLAPRLQNFSFELSHPPLKLAHCLLGSRELSHSRRALVMHHLSLSFALLLAPPLARCCRRRLEFGLGAHITQLLVCREHLHL
jgi:hypothetical protein